jgi:hypothetical protein
MKFNTVKMTFCAELPKDDMLKILAKDNISLRSRKNSKTLLDKLQTIEGIGFVEYDGHFGSNIFVEINEPNNAKLILKDIKDCIEEYLS